MYIQCVDMCMPDHGLSLRWRQFLSIAGIMWLLNLFITVIGIQSGNELCAVAIIAGGVNRACHELDAKGTAVWSNCHPDERPVFPIAW